MSQPDPATLPALEEAIKPTGGAVRPRNGTQKPKYAGAKPVEESGQKQAAPSVSGDGTGSQLADSAATAKPTIPPKLPCCVPEEARGPITAILRRIQAARGRRLFVLVSSEIGYDIREQVYQWRNELGAGNAEGVDVLLHSPGGVLSACYQIARLLGSRLDAWEALVPSMAASGATLISLGSAKVVMGEMAQLGPIDPQVGSKRHERVFATERQSPLEAFEAVRYLREFALTSLNTNWIFLLRQRVAPKPALDTASSLAFHLVQPILTKIEPYDLGAFALDSRLSLQYCSRVGSPVNLAKRTQRQVNYRALVEDYPAHEFIIDLEEARALKFVAEAPPSSVDVLFDELRPYLSRVDRYIGFVPEEGS